MREADYFGRNAQRNTALRHAEAAGDAVAIAPSGAPGYGTVIPPKTHCGATRADGGTCVNPVKDSGMCFGHRTGAGNRG